MSQCGRWLDLRDHGTFVPALGCASRGTGHLEMLANQVVNLLRGDEPTRVLRCLLDPTERLWIMERLWKIVCDNHGPEGLAGFTLSDIRFHGGQINGDRCVLFELPDPSRYGEPFMIAARFPGHESRRGFVATAARIFVLERSSDVRRVGTVTERIGGLAQTRAIDVEASISSFMRVIARIPSPDDLSPPHATYCESAPVSPRSLITPQEIRMFALDLRSLHVADTASGLILALRKAATDFWLCTVDSDSGGRSSAWLPPFDPSREATERLVKALGEMIGSLAQGVALGQSGNLTSPEVVDLHFAQVT